MSANLAFASVADFRMLFTDNVFSRCGHNISVSPLYFYKLISASCLIAECWSNEPQEFFLLLIVFFLVSWVFNSLPYYSIQFLLFFWHSYSCSSSSSICSYSCPYSSCFCFYPSSSCPSSSCCFYSSCASSSWLLFRSSWSMSCLFYLSIQFLFVSLSFLFFLFAISSFFRTCKRARTHTQRQVLKFSLFHSCTHTSSVFRYKIATAMHPNQIIASRNISAQERELIENVWESPGTLSNFYGIWRRHLSRDLAGHVEDDEGCPIAHQLRPNVITRLRWWQSCGDYTTPSVGSVCTQQSGWGPAITDTCVHEMLESTVNIYLDCDLTKQTRY